MTQGSFDQRLLSLCSPEEIKRQYTAYKRSKLDGLHASTVVTLADLRALDGASLEEVWALEDWQAGFPAQDTATLNWGGKSQEVALVGIPMGADGVTYRAFENQIDHHAQQIAGRLESGKYLFYPFRDIVVMKRPPTNGHRPTRAEIEEAISRNLVRILTVASIRDAIVQRVLEAVLTDAAEERFSVLDGQGPVSFAYRPCKSAPDAARKVRQHMRRGFVHVLDADLNKFFDRIPRKALLDVCADLVDPAENPLTFDLLRRFTHVDRVHYLSYHWARDDRGCLVRENVFKTTKPRFYEGEPRRDQPQRYRCESGVPQGGVISGLLANLYLHGFDEWVTSELRTQIPLRYVRYADDFVILTQSRDDTLAAYEAVRERVERSTENGGWGLRMHPLEAGNPEAKTKYLDTSHTPVKFVGFEISPSKLRVHPDNIQRFMQKWQDAVASEIELREDVPEPKERLRRLIKERLRYKVIGYVVPERCRRCGRDRPAYRSWISFYSGVSDWRQIRALEKWMKKQIYDQFRTELPDLTASDLRELGLPSLMRRYKRMRELNRQPSACCTSADSAIDLCTSPPLWRGNL